MLAQPPTKIDHPTNLKSPCSDPDYTASYLKYFDSVAEAATSTLLPNSELLTSHGTRLFNEKLANVHEYLASTHSMYTSAKAVVTNVEHGAAVVTYDVLLGPYIVTITLLNLSDHVFDISESICHGSFGNIIPLADEKE